MVKQATPIRILSVEDHPVFREGLCSIISSQPDMLLVAQATNAVEAFAEFRRHHPDVTLMDLRLPGANGVDALISIRGEAPQARVIILSTSETDGEIQRAMRAGASAYIFKGSYRTDIGFCVCSFGTARWGSLYALADNVRFPLDEFRLPARANSPSHQDDRF